MDKMHFFAPAYSYRLINPKLSYFISITYTVIEELRATGKFELMDLHVDEAEHSMEMHLPYLAKVFHG